MKLAKPPKKQIQKWINALRSGEYAQARKALQTREGYCCYGVMCRIAIPKGLIKRKRIGNTDIMVGAMPSSQPFAPKWLINLDDDTNIRLGQSLAFLNDHGYTFDEIADLIQLLYIEEAI